MIRANYIGNKRAEVHDLMRCAAMAAEQRMSSAESEIARARSHAATHIRNAVRRARAHHRRVVERELERERRALTTQSERERQAIIAESLKDCLAIALKIAREIIGESFHADPAIIADRLRAELTVLAEQERVVVVVHPDAVSLTRHESLPDVIKRCEVRGDASVAPGDAVIVTRAGTITVSWEGDFERLCQSLCGSMERLLVVQQSAGRAISAEGAGI